MEFKTRRNLLIITALVVLAGNGCQSIHPDYMDDDLPAEHPVLFAPGIVNTEAVELNAVFNTSMDEFFFTRIINQRFVIHHSKKINGQWTAPEPVEMFPDTSKRSTAVDMSLSPDGHTMYFLGRYSADSTYESASFDIWVSRKIDGKWQLASVVPEPVSTEYGESYPVVVADGSLYFVSDRPGGVGRRDIYRAQHLGDGKFDTPLSIGPVVNTPDGSGDTYVSSDESLLVYSSRRPGGTSGMFVSFRKGGEWGEPIYLGEPINSEWTDFCPMMTPDGEYFFFSRRYSDPPESGWDGVFEGEVYWMDASVIYRLNANRR